MKTSKKEVHKWLRKHESISTGVMMNKDAKPTANKDDMSNLILYAKRGIKSLTNILEGNQIQISFSKILEAT